jgi:hypothetical protein
LGGTTQPFNAAGDGDGGHERRHCAALSQRFKVDFRVLLA